MTPEFHCGLATDTVLHPDNMQYLCVLLTSILRGPGFFRKGIPSLKLYVNSITLDHCPSRQEQILQHNFLHCIVKMPPGGQN